MSDFGSRSKNLIILIPTFFIITLVIAVAWFVNSITLVSLSIEKLPTKSTYITGQNFNKDGMVLAAHYSFGIKKEIRNFRVNVPEVFNKNGVYNYLAIYSDRDVTKYAPFSITVMEKMFTEIRIDSMPESTTYVVGQQFSQKGLKLSAVYNGEIVESINMLDPDLTLSVPTLNTAGHKILKISLTKFGVEISVDINLTVVEREIVELSVKRQPEKLSYVETQMFDSNGLILSGKYNDGTEENVLNYTTNFLDVVKNIGNNQPLTLTTTYNSKKVTTEIFIDILELQAQQIVVSAPIKTQYFVGDTFDSKGLQVQAIFNDNTSKVLAFDEYAIDFDNVIQRAGYGKSVSINYLGSTASFEIDVANVLTEETEFAFENGMLTGFSDFALKQKNITFPKSINGVDIVSIRIPYQANNGLDDGSLVLDLTNCTSLKSILIEKFIAIEFDFTFPPSTESIFVMNDAYNSKPYFDGKKFIQIKNILTFENGKISMKENKSEIKHLIFPSLWTGKEPVESIVQGADSMSSVESCIISEGVISIENLAFRKALNLKLLALPQTLENIGSDVFKLYGGIIKLEQIALGRKVKTIESNSFNSCANILFFKVDPLNEFFTEVDGNLYKKDKSVLICAAPKNVKPLAIPSETKEIAAFALYKYVAFSTISIPAGVEKISENAFESAELISVFFEENSALKSIGYRAFNSCQKLTYFTVGQNVEFIGSEAFKNTSLMTGIEFKTTKIKGLLENTFENSGIVTVEIPANCTYVSKETFLNCTSLVQVAFPNSLITLADESFKDCTKLEMVNLNKIENFSNFAFIGCNKLSVFDSNSEHFTVADGVIYGSDALICYPIAKVSNNFVLPGHIKKISKYAFAYTKFLVGVDLLNVETIEENAFFSSSSITNIEMRSVMSIGKLAFSKSEKLTTLNLPASLTKIDPTFTSGTQITGFTVNPSSISFKSVNDVLYSFDGKTIVSYPKAKAGAMFNIPSGVESVGAYAFSEAKNLITITSTSEIINVYSSAFSNASNVKSMFNMAKLKVLEQSAFESMSSMTSFDLGSSSINILSTKVFENCGNVTSLKLPTGLISISTGAFDSCTKLKILIIPQSVTSLGSNAIGKIADDAQIEFSSAAPPSIQNNTFSSILTKGFKIYVPKAAVVAYKTAFYWKDLAAFIFSK